MEVDREMRCRECGSRLFTSRAPELVDHGKPCPECGGELDPVPAPSQHEVQRGPVVYRGEGPDRNDTATRH
jgi:hypothetical protein